MTFLFWIELSWWINMKREDMKIASKSEILVLNKYKGNIYKAWKIYNAEFVNRKITYITNTKELTLVCKNYNFMHLCGIDYLNKNARKFYYDCSIENLNFLYGHIKIKSNGDTIRKLQVISSLEELIIADKVLIVGNVVRINSQYNYLLRSHKDLIGMGLGSKPKKSYNFPVSILNLKHETLPKGEKVNRIVIES